MPLATLGKVASLKSPVEYRGGNFADTNASDPAIPAATQVGDLLIFSITNSYNYTAPVISGWTLVDDGSFYLDVGFPIRVSTYTRVAQAGDAGATVTFTNSTAWERMHTAWKNAKTATVTRWTQQGSGSYDTTSPSHSNVSGGSAQFIFMPYYEQSGNSGGSVSTPAGFVNLVNDSVGFMNYASYRLPVSGTVASATFSKPYPYNGGVHGTSIIVR